MLLSCLTSRFIKKNLCGERVWVAGVVHEGIKVVKLTLPVEGGDRVLVQIDRIPFSIDSH